MVAWQCRPGLVHVPSRAHACVTRSSYLEGLRRLDQNAPMPGNESRSVGLDFLRFGVATAVLCAHANTFGNAGKAFGQSFGPLGKILAWIPGTGPLAVEVFFVLSGFLVSGLLFEEARKTGSVMIGRFLVRRGFKIYPAFWFMIACTVVWMWFNHHSFPVLGLTSELLYFQNYKYYLCFHTWSLAVEEHFYFLLAGLFWILKRRSRTKAEINFAMIPDLFLAVAIACLFLRFLAWFLIIVPTNQNIYWFTRADHVVLDSLFFGTMLSYFWHYRWDDRMKQRLARWRWGFAVAGIALLSPGVVPIMGMEWYWIVGYILAYLGAGCLLLSCLSLNYISYPRIVKWLAWLGRHSYSVYLWHAMVGYSLFQVVSPKIDTPGGWALDTLIYLALCWLVGVLMARSLEFPVLRMRDRFFPRGAS